MEVLITGVDGFIGKNLSVQLKEQKNFEVLRISRESTEDDLRQAVAKADFICHLAGVNRSVDMNEFVSVNAGLTEMLCQEVKKSGKRVPIIFTSSAHAEPSNSVGCNELISRYGESKLAAEKILLQYSKEIGNPVYIFRLPHVIGKWGKPNYNSVVATFCYNIARDFPIQINDPNYLLKVVYVDDLVNAFMRVMTTKEIKGPYCQVEPIYALTVGDLADQLRAFRDSRNSFISERVGAGLPRVLYATYLSYLPTADFAYEIPMHCDSRGVFVEMLKTKDSGQFSFFTAHPGITRGGHYHHSKTEKFLVITGKAFFRFRHILTGEFYEVYTSGDKPEIVEMVPGWTHDITNVGNEEMVVLLWANEIFDRDHPDTFSYPI